MLGMFLKMMKDVLLDFDSTKYLFNQIIVITYTMWIANRGGGVQILTSNSIPCIIITSSYRLNRNITFYVYNVRSLP